MIRKRQEWKIRGGVITLGERTLIMGVLNVAPDSFSDGGQFSDPASALDHALLLQHAGADLIDIGAESTRPGSPRVSEHDETSRLIPVLKKLKGKLEIPISVDTYKPAVAELAIQHGASIINDVSGLTWEPDLAKVVRDTGAGLILNHMRGTPESWAKLPPMRDVMGEIAAELEASVHRARHDGVEVDHIMIDPGIGFGKRKEQNWELIARLTELGRLLLPILAGPSRKSFLAQKDPADLEYATAAAVTACILKGVAMVRVHNVAMMKPVIEAVDAMVAAQPEPKEEVAQRPDKKPRMRDLDLRPSRDTGGPPRPTIKRSEPLIAAKPRVDEEISEAPERTEQPEQPEHAERTERPERAERPERTERPERSERPDRAPRRDVEPKYGKGRDDVRPPRDYGRPGRDDSQRGERDSGPGRWAGAGASRGPGSGPSRGPGGGGGYSRGPGSGGPSRGPGGGGGYSRGPGGGGPSRGPGGGGGYSRGPGSGGPSRGPGGGGGFSRGPGSGPSRGPGGGGGFSRGPGSSGPSRGPGGGGGFSRGPGSGGPSRGPGGGGGFKRGPGSGPSRGPGGSGPSRGGGSGPSRGPWKGPGGGGRGPGRGPSTPKKRG